MSRTFDLVTQILQEQDTPFLLIGGVAVGNYIATRVTLDLDLAMKEEDARRVLPLLLAAGFSTLHETTNFIRLNPPAGAAEITDILYMDGATFDLLWKSRQIRTVGGRSIALAAPEHLIRMKLHALRYGRPDRINKDVPDILELMPLCGWTPEHPAFLEACTKHGNEAIRDILRERWKTWRK